MKIQLQDSQKHTVNDPSIVAKTLAGILKNGDAVDRDKEHLWGIYLDNRNKIKRIELVSLGTLNSSLVHPRELLKPAIDTPCASFMFVHNHPSGDPQPSEADITVTKRLKEAGQLMGIQLLDALIITEDAKYYSFRESNLI